MWIVRVALSRPYTFIVVALLMLLISPLVILRTPTDIFPNVNIPVVAVLWNYTGLSAEEMEERITTGFERGLTTSVNDMEHIESQTVNGRSIVKVFFHPDVKIEMAVAQVTALAQSSVRQMPPGTTPPYILVYNASSVPILQLGLSGKGLNEQQLFDFATQQIRTGSGDGAGCGDSVALRGQAAAGDDRHPAGPAEGKGTVARRCGECGKPAEPDSAGRNVRRSGSSNTTSI